MWIVVPGNMSDRGGADGAIGQETTIDTLRVRGVFFLLVMKELGASSRLGKRTVTFGKIRIPEIAHSHRSDPGLEKLGRELLEGLGEGRAPVHVTIDIHGGGLAAHHAAHRATAGAVGIIGCMASKSRERYFPASGEVLHALRNEAGELFFKDGEQCVGPRGASGKVGRET